MRRGQILAIGLFSTAVGLARVGQAADAPPTTPSSLPEVLRLVAPSVVRVHCGDVWGTGFVFGTRHTVITSYAVVNRRGDLEVIAADGKARTPRVAAWSAPDDLALLELDGQDLGRPLDADSGAVFAGMDTVMLYQPENPELDDEHSRGWSTPVARFSKVGRVAPNELDIDFNNHGLLGDDGAVVITPTGHVLGMISDRSVKQHRVIVTRVERVAALMGQRDRQGSFSPAGRSSVFAGMFVSPLATTVFQRDRERTQFVGAGWQIGYHFNWIFTSFAFSVFQSTGRRVTLQTSETVDRFQLEFDAGAGVDLAKGATVFAGPWLGLALETVYTTSVDAASGSLQSTNRGRGRARPGLEFGLVTSPFLLRDVFTFGSDAEARIDFGLVTGW